MLSWEVRNAAKRGNGGKARAAATRKVKAPRSRGVRREKQTAAGRQLHGECGARGADEIVLEGGRKHAAAGVRGGGHRSG